MTQRRTGSGFSLESEMAIQVMAEYAPDVVKVVIEKFKGKIKSIEELDFYLRDIQHRKEYEEVLKKYNDNPFILRAIQNTRSASL
jgi:hypothetical protein